MSSHQTMETILRAHPTKMPGISIVYRKHELKCSLIAQLVTKHHRGDFFLTRR